MITTEMQSKAVDYPVADEAIEQMRREYLQLEVRDAKDSDGYKAVRAARIAVKNKRVAIEKKRKELKADALEYGRMVDGEAKRLTSLLEPVESHLIEHEDFYKTENDRIKREAEEKRQARLKHVVSKFAAVGATITTYEVDELTNEQLEAKYAEAEQAFAEKQAKEEAERKEREERERIEAEQRRSEEERLAAERAELERQRQEAEAERAKIEAEKRRIEEEEAERQRKIEAERREKEAAERAVREAEEKRQREEAEAKAKAEAEAAEKARLEALRPDHEKLLAVADLVAAIEVPEVSSDEAADVAGEISMLLGDAVRRIKAAANKLG